MHIYIILEEAKTAARVIVSNKQRNPSLIIYISHLIMLRCDHHHLPPFSTPKRNPLNGFRVLPIYNAERYDNRLLCLLENNLIELKPI